MKIETKFDICGVAWYVKEYTYNKPSEVSSTIVRIISYSWSGLSYQTDNGSGFKEDELFKTQAEAQTELERRAKK